MLSRTHVERGDLVEQPDVPGPGELVAEQLGEMEKAEGAEPVVDGHDDDVAPWHQAGAVVPGDAARAGGERAAVDPDHDRPAGVVEAGGPDVERQAVLARSARARPAPMSISSADGFCGAFGPNDRRVAHAGPRLGRLRAAGTGGPRSEARRRGCRRTGARPRRSRLPRTSPCGGRRTGLSSAIGRGGYRGRRVRER